MNPLETIEPLLGADAFLVPCIQGTKMPAVTYTQRPFEATRTPAYRHALASGEFNIAVYLGQMSGGLCALDFDQDEDLAAFLAVNPPLAATTRSRGSRGGMVWLRVTGEFPASCTTKHFEWRANGRLSTIYGRHPKGMDYTLLVAAPPVAVAFAEIIWPDGWELPWVGAAERDAVAALAKEYGQPFYTNKDGKVNGINERYWAALYARENRVLFDPDEKNFYRYTDDTGLWEIITPESIREVISGRILEISRESQQFTLEIQITSARLNAVVSTLKGIVERRDAFKVKQRYIHVANGVIRFVEDVRGKRWQRCCWLWWRCRRQPVREESVPQGIVQSHGTNEIAEIRFRAGGSPQGGCLTDHNTKIDLWQRLNLQTSSCRHNSPVTSFNARRRNPTCSNPALSSARRTMTRGPRSAARKSTCPTGMT
jgi:hypothetical protein